MHTHCRGALTVALVCALRQVAGTALNWSANDVVRFVLLRDVYTRRTFHVPPKNDFVRSRSAFSLRHIRRADHSTRAVMLSACARRRWMGRDSVVAFKLRQDGCRCGARRTRVPRE